MRGLWNNHQRLATLALTSCTCALLVVLTYAGTFVRAWLALSLWFGLVFLLSRHHLIKQSNSVSKSASSSTQSRLVDVYRNTAEVLASAIAAKDSYEQHHVKRVDAICSLVGAVLHLSTDEIDGIRVAALVHDIGKLGVPEYILLKPGKLDPEEFGKMRNHSTVGAQILSQVDYPWNVADMVRHHHENYDGSGYPDHLAGDSIPLGSRIISIAEVYDALVSARCYKEGWSHDTAVEHIKKLSGFHFDPDVVTAFLEVESEVATIVSQYGQSNEKEKHTEEGKSYAAADLIAQANNELISLFEISQTLSSTLEIDEVLGLLASRTRRLCDGSACAVYLVDEVHSQTLVARTAVGRWHDIIKGSTIRIGKGATGKAAAHMTSYNGNYDPNEASFGLNGHLASGFRSCLVAPIISSGNILGTINVYGVTPHAFSKDDLRTLNFVANRAALAIQNANTFEHVRDSAVRDPLTGLHNGRYLHTHLEHQMRRSSRRGEPLSVIGIDLENFKAVNDSLGHQKGDTVLKDAAAIFQAQLRDYDQVFRNGGDEFVVVLPGTPDDEAIAIAERIQNKMEQYAQQYAGETSAPLGASVGVATFPKDAGDLESLLSAADAAMYRDKRARKRGRLAA